MLRGTKARPEEIPGNGSNRSNLFFSLTPLVIYRFLHPRYNGNRAARALLSQGYVHFASPVPLSSTGRTADGQRVAITISGHYDRMGSVLRRTNTDELTDQVAGTVYHCGPACAALANRSVTPILYPDQFHQRLHLPPLVADPFPVSPALRPLRNYKHSFHTKSGQRSPTVRNESRASRIFATDYHPFALTFSPLPPHPQPLFVLQWSTESLFQIFAITGYRVRPRARMHQRECSEIKKKFYQVSKKRKNTIICTSKKCKDLYICFLYL